MCSLAKYNRITQRGLRRFPPTNIFKQENWTISRNMTYGSRNPFHLLKMNAAIELVCIDLFQQQSALSSKASHCLLRTHIVKFYINFCIFQEFQLINESSVVGEIIWLRHSRFFRQSIFTFSRRFISDLSYFLCKVDIAKGTSLKSIWPSLLSN